MSKSAESRHLREASSEGQLWPWLPGLVREALHDMGVIVASLACAHELLEAERVALYGARHEDLFDRKAQAGTASPVLVLGGR